MAAVSIALDMLKEVLKFAGVGASVELDLISKSKDELEGLKKEVAMIVAVLRDAEKRSIQERAVRVWLAELRDVCYDLQDLLEPFLLQFRRHSKSRVRVRYLHSLHTRSAFNRDIKAIREKINETLEWKNKYALVECTDLDLQLTQSFNKDRPTTSLPEPEVVGRDEDQSNIVNLIRQNQSSEQLFVIPILGMGGIGKTTLAKKIYNDDSLRDSRHFELRGWAYVSPKFDLLNVARGLLESLKGSACNSQNLEVIHQELRNKVSCKRFLIVLDDVWNIDLDEHWRELKAMLEGSSRGSVILVTTRITETAQHIATIDPYYLKTLSEKTCMQLFQKKAFKSTIEMNTYPSLVAIGKQIVKKCGGIALAANALGHMLFFSRDEDYWLHVKDSEIWKLHINSHTLSSPEKKILSSLMLSYNYMPPHLKLCFAYCSIFPKGCRIERYKLKQCWICLNFISHIANRTLEDIAEDYINNLISMSFLQKCYMRYDSEEMDGVVMHDLMHDLAQFVADDHDIKVITNEEDIQNANTTPYRYVSLLGFENYSKVDEIVQQKARAIYFKGNAIAISDESFSQLACLRVLEVNGALPKPIKQLKQLRHLSASHLKELPNLTSFPNLQYLDLHDTTIAVSDINLQSLQYLILSEVNGLGTLISANLPNLLHLAIVGCDDLEELPNLTSFPNLQYLNLHDTTIAVSDINLQSLQYLRLSKVNGLGTLISANLPNLLHLAIVSCDDLEELPKCFGDLENLKYLRIPDCKQLETLPITNLPNLLELEIFYCPELLKLPECLRDLQNLERLHIDTIVDLSYLSDLLEALTCLKSLVVGISEFGGSDPVSSSASISEIRRFSNLETLKMDLEFNVITEDVEGEEGIKQCTNIAALQYLHMLDGKLTISGLGRVKDPKDAEKANLKAMHKLKSLKLYWDVDQEEYEEEDDTVWDEEVGAAVIQSLQPPSSNLMKLRVDGYVGSQFPSWMMDNQYKLERLEFSELRNIKKIDRELFGGTLRRLYISDMMNLEEVQFAKFPCLVELLIYDCSEALKDEVVSHFQWLSYMEIGGNYVHVKITRS